MAGDARRVLVLFTAVAMVGSVLLCAGCYRKTIGASGIGAKSGRTIEEPDAPPPDAPLFPWFGDDKEGEPRGHRSTGARD